MTIINSVLENAGDIAGLAAIFCILFHIGRGMYHFSEGNYNEICEVDNWGWSGLVLLAIWMACKIGLIGL